MTTEHKAGHAGQAAALPEEIPFEDRPPLHQAFQWSDPRVCDRMPAFVPISFIGHTRDIANGAATVLEILERCQLDAFNSADDDRPLLSLADQGNLMRFSIAALTGLSERAAELTQWVDENGPRWSQEDRTGRRGGQP